ncbi:MAG: hypothetical protein GF384_04315, partial [Elusimicrobia bacterium]|nr:hypothetical protein [Elusimicrobiota bacterium]
MILIFRKFILGSITSLLVISPLFGEEQTSPVYSADLPNLSDFSLFANTGWDGNWFVGYSKVWIQKIDVTRDKKNFAKTFIGAKLGRMKTQMVDGKPEWESEAVPGSIYIAISSTPTWTKDQQFFLVSTYDIPYEGHHEVAMQKTAESRWFWAEI